MLAAIPNYYYTQSYETSMFGTLLKAVAREQARLEWRYQYDLVTRDFKALYPHDMKRQWAGPLFISKNFPSVTQTDSAYREMVANLIKAFRGGSTANSIRDVIKAYTGQSFYVEELYKQIDVSSYYDQSDRNTIRICLYAYTKGNYASNQISVLSQDLYDAVDLAKPAHVGVNLTSIFGLDEDIGVLIDAMQDQLQIRVQLLEGDQLDEMFVLGPLHDASNPDTRLSPELPGDSTAPKGILAPRLHRTWEIVSDDLFASDAD
jgi:hypothetical protein